MKTSLIRAKIHAGQIRRFFPFICLLLVFTIFAFSSDKFFQTSNTLVILKQCAVLSVIATGETLVILSGSIDLSVGSISGLCAVVCALLLTQFGPVAMLFGALVGVAAGVVNGIMFSKFKIPSFIMTLGMMTLARGVIMILTQGKPIMITDPLVRWIGGGSVLFGFPVIVIIAAVLVLLTYILVGNTAFGRYIYAIGGGEHVSAMSGVPVDRMKILVFLVCGILTGLGGVLMAARVGAGAPTLGQGLELDAIGAVVLGGTPLTGGFGSIVNTIIGALIMTILANGLNIMGVSSYTQMVIKGAVIILAVAITMDRKKIGIIK